MFDPPMEMPGSNELARAEHELATLRALYAEAVRALAANRAQATGTYSKKPCGHHFFCLCAAEASEAVISRPEAQEVLRG